MKRLIMLIVLMLGLSTSIYFLADKIKYQFNNNGFDFGYIVMLVSTGVLLLALGICVVMFSYRRKDKKIKWLNNRLEQWSNLSVHVNKAGDEVFSELPIGIIIYDEQHEIKWVNRFAKQIFNDELLEKNLFDINEFLATRSKDGEHAFTISIGELAYDVIHKKDNRLLYLFDVSARETLSKKYTNRTVALGIINLDNLEMETKSFDIQESANIRGQYLGEISDWALKYNGYLRSYDDGCLIVLADYESLLKMIEEKFDVLEKIRLVSKNNGIRITGSIGFACYDTNYEELGILAQNSIDLAEKRGGDQAVVNIQGAKIQYFGASVNALEKRTLLDARVHAQGLKEVIEASDNVYITCHIQADVDAIGAMIGALRLSLSSKKKTKLVIDINKLDATSTKIYNDILINEENLKDNFISPDELKDITDDSLLLVVDTQSPKIIMTPSILEKFKKIAVVDHHRSGVDVFNNTVYSYVEPSASSSVELISEMLNFYNIKEPIVLNANEATIMLAGIVVDTNNFTFRCGSRTFDVASSLKEQGADMIFVRQILRNDFDKQMHLNKYLSLAKIVLDKFAIVVIEEELDDRTLLAKVSESLINIEGIDAAFSIAVVNDGNTAVMISARSYRDVNVQIIMEELGGGGHLNSAATQLVDKTVYEAKASLIEILKREFEVGDEIMKVILLEDVKGRGLKGQIIEVATGYGNFLLTNNKGLIANETNVSELENNKKQELLRLEDEKKMMLKIKDEIESKTVNVYIKVGQDGKSFGHVTTKQICEEFEAQYGIHLDKRKLSLPIEIQSIGIYTANVQLHREVVAQLEINVLEK